MNSPVTLQSILNHHLEIYQRTHRLSPQQSKACHRIQQCRTEALGGRSLECIQCGQSQIQYHSCRNRHCPQCQGRATTQWSERQTLNLLPVVYYHVIFTLPHTLNGWVQLHPKALYQMLFKSAWTTIKTFGQDPKRLNGEMGMTAVLHSWGQTLGQHIHLHCLIPGGAWNKELKHWKPSSSHYLFPVKALSRKFRGHLVSQLREQINSGQLKRITRDVNAILDQLMTHEWNVFCKPHLKRPETIVRYLARYTHKIAIDNTRIENDENSLISFRYKDYQDHEKIKRMQLTSDEFIRRYLLHILPDGFMRIRHYGYLANSCRQKKLPAIRQALVKQREEEQENSAERQKTESGVKDQKIKRCLCSEPGLCPACQRGVLRLVQIISPKRRRH